jgi:hypothetical protein
MGNELSRISDSIEFPLKDLDKNIADIVPLMPPPARWAAFNAIRNLNLSWRMLSLDPEMALFRAITAEEEAAASLFLSLKRRHYNGATNIRHHDHIHKNGLIPFIGAVSRLLKRIREIRPQMDQMQLLINDKQKPARLLLRVKIPKPGTEEYRWGEPTPPLHFLFSIHKKQANSSDIYDFRQEIMQIATERGSASIMDHIRERANFRNRLLYAAANGYPCVVGDINPALLRYQRNVFTILKLYLMIDPYPKQQSFVQQCLSAYLKMLNLVPQDVVFE